MNKKTAEERAAAKFPLKFPDHKTHDPNGLDFSNAAEQKTKVHDKTNKTKENK